MNQHYLAGFFDGEGSLIIRFKKDSRYASGFQIKPNIDIAQKNLEVLNKIKNDLKIGKIYYNKKEKLWHYDIYKFKDIENFISIIKGKLIVKRDKLKKFEACISLILGKQHLDLIGLNKIRKIWLIRESEANTL